VAFVGLGPTLVACFWSAVGGWGQRFQDFKSQ